MANQICNRDDTIDVLGLTVRVYNALKRASINSVGKLSDELQQDSLWQIRNLGEKGIAEIEAKLKTVDIISHFSETQNYPTGGFSAVSDISVLVDLGPPTIPVHHAIKSLQLVLSNQIRIRILHPDLEIEGEPLVDLVKSKRIYDVELYAKLISVLTSSQSVADELETLFSLAALDERQLTVLRMRYGFQKHTLEEVGDMIQVTRERVRQIETQVLQRIIGPMQSHFIARIRSAMLFAANVDLSFTEWTLGLLKSGLVGDWSNEEHLAYDPIEMMLAVCSITSTVEFPESLQYMIRLHRNGESTRSAKSLMLSERLTSEANRLILRHLRHSGAVSLEWLVNQDTIDYSMNELRLILESKGYFGLDKNWYMSLEYVPGRLGKDSVLHRSLLKMFQYCGPLGIRDVYFGIEHTLVRTDFPIPPTECLEVILHNCGYTNEVGLWYWNGDSSEELNTGEQILLDTIESLRGVAHHSELMKAIIDSPLASPSLHATLKRSPLIEKFDRGLYRLRGSEPNHESVERALDNRTRVPVDLTSEYDINGNIVLAANIGILALASGTIVSENLPNLAGVWALQLQNGESQSIQVTENEIRGLQQNLQLLDCEVGDRIRMVFSTDAHEVSVALFGDLE